MKKTVSFKILWMLLLLLNIFMIFRVMPRGSEKIIAASADTENIGLLDVQIIGFDKEIAYSLLNAMGEQGRRQYAVFAIREDMVFPITYGLFLALTLFLLTQKRFQKKAPAILISLLPLLAMAADFVENHLILLLI